VRRASSADAPSSARPIAATTPSKLVPITPLTTSIVSSKTSRSDVASTALSTTRALCSPGERSSSNFETSTSSLAP
jgi:hypothetical protein